jgi:tyrosinase
MAEITRAAVPRPIRIRRNAHTADPAILSFYGQAIREMKLARLSGNPSSIASPVSWRYQAAIHAYARDRDPNADATDLPLPADQGTFWTVCEHSNWFFLPWHRMYLHYFEMIVLSHVVRLGGPTDWALPYWNYSNPGQLTLPAAFRSPATAANQLFIPQRDPDANGGGTTFAEPRPAGARPPFDIAAAMRLTAFENAGGTAGFGGSSAEGGSLEGTPHGSMHVRIAGGSTGFMFDFAKVGLDPIFWLHHCNIDRLWTAWLRQGGGRANPTDAAWLGASFPFHDASGQRADLTVRQVVDTRAEPLAYVYDDEPV